MNYSHKWIHVRLEDAALDTALFPSSLDDSQDGPSLREINRDHARLRLQVPSPHLGYKLRQCLILPFQKKTAKAPRPSGWLPGLSTCLRTSIFLFFLLIQTVGFFCYMNFRWACPRAGLSFYRYQFGSVELEHLQL